MDAQWLGNAGCKVRQALWQDLEDRPGVELCGEPYPLWTAWFLFQAGCGPEPRRGRGHRVLGRCLQAGARLLLRCQVSG